VCTDDSGGSESEENGFVQRDHAFPGGMVTPFKVHCKRASRV
jgi:hypothetical protein